MFLFDVIGFLLIVVVFLVAYIGGFTLLIYGGMKLVVWILSKLPPVFPNQAQPHREPGVVDLTKKALNCYIDQNSSKATAIERADEQTR